MLAFDTGSKHHEKGGSAGRLDGRTVLSVEIATLLISMYRSNMVYNSAVKEALSIIYRVSFQNFYHHILATLHAQTAYKRLKISSTTSEVLAEPPRSGERYLPSTRLASTAS